MVSIFKYVAAFMLVLMLSAASEAAAKGLEDDDWIEIQTPNFRIRSALNKKDTIELARHLEMFRVAVSYMTNVSSTESFVPTEIYALRTEGDFRTFGLSSGIVGVMSSDLRQNTILIRDVRRMSEINVILHEYTHFLVRNHGTQNYPMWFDEGFAEYLSATQLRGNSFKVGMVPKHRQGSLMVSSWIPMRIILAARGVDGWSLEKQAMFYAESWALIHYLLNRPNRDTTFAEDMTAYLALVESGRDDVEAFEEAFEIKSKYLDRAVEGYLTKGKLNVFQFNVDKILPEFKASAVRLSREEVSLALGKLALQRNVLDDAERWFDIALADTSTRAHAEAGLGDVFKYRGEFARAENHFESAVALAPADPLCQLDAGEFWHFRADATDDPEERARLLALAREFYTAAWKLDNAMPEIYAMYGRTFLLEGERYEKAIELLEGAQAALPADLDIRVMLAEAYAGAGRVEDAAQAARSVLAWSHGESEIATRAWKVLEELPSEIDASVREENSND